MTAAAASPENPATTVRCLMTQYATVWTDPTRLAREAGRLQGRKEMRDQVRDQFAMYATRHPEPVVADELWGFVRHIERMDLS